MTLNGFGVRVPQWPSNRIWYGSNFALHLVLKGNLVWNGGMAFEACLSCTRQDRIPEAAARDVVSRHVCDSQCNRSETAGR